MKRVYLAVAVLMMAASLGLSAVGKPEEEEAGTGTPAAAKGLTAADAGVWNYNSINEFESMTGLKCLHSRKLQNWQKGSPRES